MATQTRQRLDTFVAKVADGQHKPQRKFIADGLRGLYVAKDCMLSEVGRALREPTRLIHTERRLSRELMSKRFL